MKTASPVATVYDRRLIRKSVFSSSAVRDRCYTGMLLLAAALLLTACSKLTAENLQKIHSGMTTEEVKAILGSPTDVQSADMLGFKSTSYTYHTRTSEVKIVFLNDKVMSTEGDFK